MTRLRRCGSEIEHRLDLVLAASCPRECRSTPRSLRPPSARPRRRASAGISPCSAASSVFSATSSPQCREVRCLSRRLSRSVRRLSSHRSRTSFELRAYVANIFHQSRVPSPSVLAVPSGVRLTAAFFLAIVCQPLRVIRAYRRFAFQNPLLHLQVVDASRVESSMAGGVVFWPSDSRAQAVSSTLTALSGNWRPAR